VGHALLNSDSFRFAIYEDSHDSSIYCINTQNYFKRRPSHAHTHTHTHTGIHFELASEFGRSVISAGPRQHSHRGFVSRQDLWPRFLFSPRHVRVSKWGLLSTREGSVFLCRCHVCCTVVSSSVYRCWPRQHSHSLFRVPRDSRPYCTLWRVSTRPHRCFLMYFRCEFRGSYYEIMSTFVTTLCSSTLLFSYWSLVEFSGIYIRSN
jgi:hypothetical protein